MAVSTNVYNDGVFPERDDNLNLSVTDLFGLLLSALEEEKPTDDGGMAGAYRITQQYVEQAADYYIGVCGS